MGLFDKTIELLQRGIALSWFRHGLLASNIANVETPGFEPRDIDFKAELEKALRDRGIELLRTNPRHLGAERSQGIRILYRGDWENPDGNRVNLEEEAVELAENYLHYMAMLRILQRKLERLKYTISEGGR